MKNITLSQVEFFYTNLLADKLGLDNSDDWEELHSKVKEFSKNRLKIQSTVVKLSNIDCYELAG